MVTIQKKRIRNISHHLPKEFQDKAVIVGIREDQATRAQIERTGLTWPLTVGETILPAVIGPITRFNALGREIAQRDQPKETHYREMEFTRSEWHGKDRVETTSCVWIPYQRYPRVVIPPPGVEILVGKSPDNTITIQSSALLCAEKNFGEIGHVVNLFLELFGVCNIFLEGDNPHTIPLVKRLNWVVLPPGTWPWEKLRKTIKENSLVQRPKTFAAALNRFELINELKPTFVATGNGGYRGYLVFGFPDKGLFVLESQATNNAIYVFGDDWAFLSQLTKAEIISGHKHIKRIIHSPSWHSELLKLF